MNLYAREKSPLSAKGKARLLDIYQRRQQGERIHWEAWLKSLTTRKFLVWNYDEQFSSYLVTQAGVDYLKKEGLI